MDMTFERDNDVLTASLVGRLDGTVAQGAPTELLHMVEETNRGLILDLRDVAFISSAGLRIILLVAKEFEKQNGKLVLCSLSEALREVFAISGFDKVIAIADSRDGAMGMV